jgi:hypothetical protein
MINENPLFHKKRKEKLIFAMQYKSQCKLNMDRQPKMQIKVLIGFDRRTSSLVPSIIALLQHKEPRPSAQSGTCSHTKPPGPRIAAATAFDGSTTTAPSDSGKRGSINAFRQQRHPFAVTKQPPRSSARTTMHTTGRGQRRHC